MNREKELKRMKRRELLELLLEVTEENEALKKEIQTLKDRLASREITAGKAGSLAEAALTLNGVFDAAQAAAAQYLENIRQLSGNQKAICQQMETGAREKAQEIRSEADAYSQKVRSEADAYSQKVRSEADAYSQAARSEADLYQKRVTSTVTSFLQEGLGNLTNPDEGDGQA